jgi:phosphoribosylanthranilate isomerase
MTEVKICGVSDAAALDAVVQAGADWVGYVFYPPSPRAVTGPEAASLHAGQPGAPPPVGLFVEPSDAEVAAVLDAVPLAALQVHAPPERAAALQLRFGVPVWLGIGVASAADLPASVPGVTRLLLDAKPQGAAALPGGNARAFDWSVLAAWDAPLPWVLAGGLTPDTVAEAVRRTGAAAVDVSSGVERSRGVKDPALIHAFVAAVRRG